MKLSASAAVLCAAILVSSASAKTAKKKAPAAPPPPPIQVQGRGTLQVEAHMLCHGKEVSTRLLTLDGVQSNFAQKDLAKNTSFVLNFQPNVADSGKDGGKDEIELQYLFECSELDKPSSTSQVQGVARLQSASDTIIADSDLLQLRVKISILKYSH